MLLSSLFITFLLEYFLTPAEDSFDKYLSRVINWVRFKFDVDDKKVALLTWSILVVGSSLALWVLEVRLARQARVQAQLQNDTAVASAEASLQRWLPEALLVQGAPASLTELFPTFTSWPTSAAVEDRLAAHPADISRILLKALIASLVPLTPPYNTLSSI